MKITDKFKAKSGEKLKKKINDKFKMKLLRLATGALVVYTILTLTSSKNELAVREIAPQEIRWVEQHNQYAILVNQDHSIPAEYMRELNLAKTKDVNGKEVYVQKQALEAFNQLQAALAKDGHVIGINSAFRTFEEQEATYNEILEQHGKEYADKIVAAVGHSEHHTGLAIDVFIERSYILGRQIPLQINPKYISNRDAMYKIMADYGFILRYPSGREEITGFPEEEWHIRYVGPELAKFITEKKLTLEEYHKFLYEYKNGSIIEQDAEMGA